MTRHSVATIAPDVQQGESMLDLTRKAVAKTVGHATRRKDSSHHMRVSKAARPCRKEIQTRRSRKMGSKINQVRGELQGRLNPIRGVWGPGPC